MKLVESLLEHKDINKSNLTLTGSSLGGALAAYIGSHLNINTVTFNAAGLHWTNVGDHTDMVANYYIKGDYLTSMQSISPQLPSAIDADSGEANAY